MTAIVRPPHDGCSFTASLWWLFVASDVYSCAWHSRAARLPRFRPIDQSSGVSALRGALTAPHRAVVALHACACRRGVPLSLGLGSAVQSSLCAARQVQNVLADSERVLKRHAPCQLASVQDATPHSEAHACTCIAAGASRVAQCMRRNIAALPPHVHTARGCRRRSGHARDAARSSAGWASPRLRSKPRCRHSLAYPLQCLSPSPPFLAHPPSSLRCSLVLRDYAARHAARSH